jgi:hypothetical protein
MKILKSYKKMAKSMLTEHAWDRKFGEPLPTLEDTAKKHQTNEEPGQGGGGHKEGDVWQTDSGWAAWKPGEKSAEYGIKDKGAAEKYAKGEKVGYDDGDNDEEEPAGKLGGGDFDRDGGDTEKDADSGGGEVDDYGVEASSLENDEDAQQNVQMALQGQETNAALRNLRDAGHEKIADVLADNDMSFDEKLKVYMRAIGESKKTSKKHPLRETYEKIGGK